MEKKSFLAGQAVISVEPKGLVLMPQLFIIHINDLAEVVKCHIFKFAEKKISWCYELGVSRGASGRYRQGDKIWQITGKYENMELFPLVHKTEKQWFTKGKILATIDVNTSHNCSKKCWT